MFKIPPPSSVFAHRENSAQTGDFFPLLMLAFLSTVTVVKKKLLHLKEKNR